MPKLIIAFQGQQRTAELRDGPNSIGRSSKCTIPVKDPSLSREHCQFVLEGDKTRLVDRGSMNGTILNGKRVWDEVLKPGDKVTIGQATIWFEKRPEGAVIPPPKPLPRQQPSKEDAGTARHRVEDEVPTRAPAPAGPPPADLPQDYSLGKRTSGSSGRILVIAVVLAVIVGLVIAGKSFLERESTQSRDDGNLVSRNAGFELNDGGRPTSWELTAGGAALRAAPAQGRSGSTALLMEKTGDAADVLTECAFSQEFALAKSGGVQVSAWTRFDSFVGRAGVKIDWLRRKNGAVVAQEFSPLADQAPDWTRIDAKFTPPHGAGAYRIALAAAGHAGRVFFDDVVARELPPGNAPEQHTLGPHTVSMTSAGVARIATRGRREVADIEVRLVSEKEGTLTQALAQGVGITKEGEVLSIRGRMFSPAALRDVPFQERLFRHGDETRVFYLFRGGDLRQLDRVEIAFILPRVDRVSNIPSDAGATTDRIWFRSDMGDIVIEFEGPPPKVSHERVRGGSLVALSFPIPGVSGDQTFGIRINDGGRRGSDDPIEVADGYLAGGRPYEAWKHLKLTLQKVRDPKKRKALEAKMHVLERLERDEWQSVQEKAFHASISKRYDKRTEAIREIEAYAKRWTDEAHAAKAEALRQEVAQAASGKEFGDRPDRILARAKAFAEGGKRALARAMLEALQARYPSFKIPDEVRQSIESAPPEEGEGAR